MLNRAENVSMAPHYHPQMRQWPGVDILQNHSKLFPDGVYRQQTFPQNYARFATFPKAVQLVIPFFITVIILFWSKFRKISALLRNFTE